LRCFAHLCRLGVDFVEPATRQDGLDDNCDQTVSHYGIIFTVMLPWESNIFTGKSDLPDNLFDGVPRSIGTILGILLVYAVALGILYLAVRFAS